MHSNRGQWALLLAWIVTLVSLIVTLYAGQVLEMPVCHLCWYQRICIYPLTIILGIASFRNDGSIGIYTIPLAILGAIFAVFHYLEQMIPGFSPIDVCKGGPSCTNIHIQYFGFMTFPFFAFLATVIITILLIIAYRNRAR